MNINERVRLLRNRLKMTQTDFGNNISITQNHLSGIEVGRREVTNRMIKLICSEFNVSEKWLRTGEGEIFVEQSIDDAFAEIIAKATLTGNEQIKELMIMANKLNEKQLKAFVNFLETMVED